MVGERQPVPLKGYLAQYELKGPCGLRTTLELMERISHVTRPSGKEGPMGDLLVAIAKEYDLLCQRDEIGNVVIYHPGSSGCQNAPGIVLQSHQDMICKSDEGKPNPAEHGVKPIVIFSDGPWVATDGTTGGYDNSAGIAQSLAYALDRTAVHGPLMLVFTVGEETDMRGVNNFGFAIDPQKYPFMVNLDNEEEGVLAIGTAAAGYTEISMPVKREDLRNKSYLKIKVSGTKKDRHSGLDIHKGRINAVKILAGGLSGLIGPDGTSNIHLVEITGDNAPQHIRNSISREAEAVVALDPDQVEIVKRKIEEYQRRMKRENETNDPDLEITVEDHQYDSDAVSAMTVGSTKKTVETLIYLPHGVYHYTEGHPDMVITSTNLAIASSGLNETNLSISMMTRSADLTELEALRREIANLVVEEGVTVSQSEIIKGYKAKDDSRLLPLSSAVYKGLFGRELVQRVYHAGAEMGEFGVRFPDLDIVSMGATLHNPHDTKEQINISSIYRCNRFLWT
ncbi:M20/M25/M40 family metallo-hydrolase, partial [Candidatus Microgenomates bacterium]|nr:M20/M25/M40 family metallo-hydrolase [Candidatus Microgenomates bacterium]